MRSDSRRAAAGGDAGCDGDGGDGQAGREMLDETYVARPARTSPARLVMIADPGGPRYPDALPRQV